MTDLCDARLDRRRSRSVLTMAVLAVAAVLFAVLTVVVSQHGTTGWDLAGHTWAMHRRGTLVARIAGWVTHGGEFGRLLPAVLLVGLLTATGGWPRRARTALTVGVVFAGGALLRLAVADLVGRPRPPQADWLGPAAGFAFPSGHTTAAALGVGLMAGAVSRRLIRRWLRAIVWAAAGLYALCVGWSRVWLGVHWPADVVGAWLFAVLWLALARTVPRMWPPRSASAPTGVRDPVDSRPGGCRSRGVA